MWLNHVILGLYVLGMVAIAFYTRNKSKNVNDFLFAGSKGLNGWMTAFAYGTTYFSAVVFIGYAGKFGWSFGLSAVWIGIGNAIIGSLIAWKVLARRTKNMTTRLNSKTMPEFFEKRYGSKNLKLVSAIIVFIFLIPYSASVYNGINSLFGIVFGIDGWVITVILAVLTALYLFFGGYFATALSDFIQGIIMLIGVIIMLFCFLASPQVNWSEGINTLVQNGLGLFPNMPDGVAFLYSPPVQLIALTFLTSFGVWALPQTVHKYHAVRDKKAITQGMVVSTIFALIIGFIAYFIGSLGTLFFSSPNEVGGFDNIVPQMLLKVIPAGVMGIIAVLILSASMSTLSSVSLSSASVVAIDMYKGRIDKNASDKKVTIVMRVMCLVFILISVVLALLNNAYNITAIAYMMGISWGTLAGCFIGPFVYGLISKKATKTACWVSIIGGLVLTLTLIVVIGYDVGGWAVSFGTALKNGINQSPLIGVITMAFSMVVTPIVSAFTKKPSAEIIDDAFNKQVENLV